MGKAEVSVSFMGMFGREFATEPDFENERFERLELVLAGTCEGKSTKSKALEFSDWHGGPKLWEVGENVDWSSSVKIFSFRGTERKSAVQ